MKIIVKNLKGKQFDIDVEPSDTVKQVKEKIQEEQKMDSALLKLVAVGKVMDDTKTIEDYKLKDGDFIVVMIAKPKVVKEKKPDTGMTGADVSASSTGGMNTAPVHPPASTGPVGVQAPPPVPDPTSSSSAGQQPSSSEGGGILRGEALENTLKEMQDMGFPREECMRALRAAYYNADRAVDYLLNGIPAEAQEPAQPTSSSGGGSSSMGGGATGGLSGDNPLSQLANNPAFQQLRQRLISEPQFFQTFMSQLAQTQPAIHQAISANPQAFLQLLLGGGGDAGPENDPPGTIRVTQEEKEAIERLAGLGFPKHRAIEAYLSCDKNEEWAANYLFENCQVDDNYDEQVVEDESRAEVEGDIDQQLQDDVPMSSEPAAHNPPAQNPPAESQPAQNPPAEDDMNVDQPADNANNQANNDGGNQNNEGGNGNNNDDEGEDSSL